MGGQLEVAIKWSAQFLDQLSFIIKDCSVQHGDTYVAVVKEGASKVQGGRSMVRAIFPVVPYFFRKFHLYLGDAPFPKKNFSE